MPVAPPVAAGIPPNKPPNYVVGAGLVPNKPPPLVFPILKNEIKFFYLVFVLKTNHNISLEKYFNKTKYSKILRKAFKLLDFKR